MNHNSSKVPPPWTPLEITSHENQVDVNLQGRSYRFGEWAAFPTQIQTLGLDILAAPIRLVGKMAGENIEWQAPHIALLQSDESRAIITGAMGTEGLCVGNSVKIGFDGTMRFDTTITPWLLGQSEDKKQQRQSLKTLESLWLEIPLLAEYSSLYTWWPITPGGAAATNPHNSGAVPDDGIALPFKPFLWLGWQDGGLSWLCESAQGWQPEDKSRAIEVIRDGDTTLLRLRLLDGAPKSWQGHVDSWHNPLTPLTFSWGLQATPVKPLEENALKYRILHFCHNEALPTSRLEIETIEGTGQTVLERVIEADANVVVIHEAWNSIQNYWVNPRADEIKATVAACHERGLKILPYFGYELSTLAPEWAQMHERVLVKNADGRFYGGWERMPPQRDYIVCYASEWQDKWLAGIEWMLDEYGFDGVYLDGTSIPWGCANAHHGCGYEQNGERYETYPIWEVTRMFARLYNIVTTRGGIITTHQSSCCVTPTLAYSHTYLDGEHIGGLKASEDDEFPLKIFQAEFMGRPFGIQAEYLHNQSEAQAYALIHNVLVRPNIGSSLDGVAPIWKAMQEFGTPQAKWLPYWSNANFVQYNQKTLYVSAYLRGHRVLLAVANLSATKDVETSLTLQPQSVGHGGKYQSAHDAVSGEKLAVKENKVLIGCKPMAWRLIELTLE